MIPGIAVSVSRSCIFMPAEPAIVVARAESSFELEAGLAATCSHSVLRAGTAIHLHMNLRIALCATPLFYLLSFFSLLTITSVANAANAQTTNDRITLVTAIAGSRAVFLHRASGQRMNHERKPWRPPPMERQPDLRSGVLQ